MMASPGAEWSLKESLTSGKCSTTGASGQGGLRKGDIPGAGSGPQGWAPHRGRAGPELCSISQIAADPKGAEGIPEGAVISDSL